jgi:methylthioribose-1-phosphate isomerase
MKINGQPYRTIWEAADGKSVEVIDQRKLPHIFDTVRLDNVERYAWAISDMVIRGAPLIGVCAAYGLATAMFENSSDDGLALAYERLIGTRPTAVNLRWSLDRMRGFFMGMVPEARASSGFALARSIAEEDVQLSAAIGRHGAEIIQRAWSAKGQKGPVNILTHCNAGWLAAVDWGTATSPIYHAVAQGVPVHVYVDETRPRNQGASLTAFELNEEGVPHSVIVDNAGGHLMQHGQVDLCIVGSDRTTSTGDVCNKIGTYLKALAAKDNDVPFYAALPFSTIDWSLAEGVRSIPIETRSDEEVTHVSGKMDDGMIATVQITPDGSSAYNPAFDVTPARLVTGIITERGVAPATEAGLRALYA